MGFLEKLKLLKLRKYVFPFIDIFGKEDDFKKPDADTLREAYHSNLFIKAIVNITANFVFPAPPTVKCEDKTAQEILNKLYQDYYETFLQSARDASLTGNAFIKVLYNKGIDLIETYPSKVLIFPSPYDIREYERIEVRHQTDPNYTGEISSIKEVFDKEKVQVFVNDKLYSQTFHNLGEIPVIHVAYNRFSNELYGTGDINDAVFKLVQKYEKLLDAVVQSFIYHGKPMLVAHVEDRDTFHQEISKADFERFPGFVLGKEEKVEFLEAKQILKDGKDILELIFYNIVILTEVPEFLMGVHQPSSWASTKEQMHPIIRKTKRYQNIWKEKLKELNRIVLKLIEKHEGEKFSTYETVVEFPEVEQKEIKEYAQALSQLVGAGILKQEEAREVLKSVMPSLQEITKLLEEKDNYEPDKNWNEYA